MDRLSLVLCDLNRNKICDLYDNTQFRARNIVQEFSINEISTLSFTLPVIPNGKWLKIKNEQLILFDGEYFKIKNLSFKHDDGGKLYLDVETHHFSDNLAMDLISISEQTPLNVVALMKVALCYDENDQPTLGWKVGKVTVDRVAVRGLEALEQSPFSILLTIAEKFDGILKFNSQTMTVDMLERQSTTRPTLDLRVSKNLKNFSIKYDTSEMYTRLYCYGATDEDGITLDITSVNPTGKGYIDNFEYFKTIGYTEEFINSHPELFVSTNIWKDDNYYDPTDLYNDGIKELAKIAVPIVDVSISALDTKAIGLSDELTKLDLGACIRIYDEDLGVDTLCNVTKRKIDYEKPYILDATVTNSVTYHDTLSKLFTDVNTVSNVVTSGGSIIGGGGSGGGVSMDEVKDYLNVYYLNAEQIEAKYASIDELHANYATIEYLKAHYIDAESIAAGYATIGQLHAIEAKIENLDVDYINGKLAEFEKLYADMAEFKDLVANSAEIDEIKAGELTVYGTLKATNAEVENLKATSITTGEFEAYKATIEQLFALYASIEYLEANYLKAQQIEATYAKITSLDAVSATIDNLKAQVANVETLVAQKASIEDLNAVKADIETINAKFINVDKILADVITTDELNAEVAKINELIANEIKAVNATITSLDAKFATIEQLNTEIANVNKLIAEKATIEDLEAAKADIGELEAQVANIDTILSGSIGTGTLQTIHLTAKNVVIDDAVISDLIAAKISVDQLKAGIISTNKFQVQSDDGGFKVVGNTTQWTDSNGKVRMQAGRDADGNFNFAVFGADGTTRYFDETGIHEAGIPDGIIRDEMVADDANIQASKIKYVDKDGDKTLQTIIDIQQGEIETLIKETNVLGIPDPELSGDGVLIFDEEAGAYLNDLNELDFASDLLPKLTMELIVDFEDSGVLKDKFVQLYATVDGLSFTVGDVESSVTDIYSKITSINITTEGIKTEVNKISSDLEYTKTIAEQTADKFSWVVKSGTDETNFTLTDRTATLVSEQINLKGLVKFSGLSSDAQDKINESKDIIDNWGKDAVVNGTTTINGGYIKTNTIKTDQLAVNEIFATGSSVMNIINAQEINADRITSGLIRSNFLELYGLNVLQKDTDVVTLAIDSMGNVTMRGTIESYNYRAGQEGWSIRSDGDAEFNNITMRGNLLGVDSGVIGSSQTASSRQVRFWAGASYENRNSAPFRVYSDGSVEATQGTYSGVWTGDIRVGNISIVDPSSSSGNDAIFTIRNGQNGINNVELTDTDHSIFRQNVYISNNANNTMISLSQSGSMVVNNSITVGKTKKVIIDDDSINIDGSTLSNVGDKLSINAPAIDIGSIGSTTPIGINGNATVMGILKAVGEVNFNDVIVCKTSSNGIDFNFKE